VVRRRRRRTTTMGVVHKTTVIAKVGINAAAPFVFRLSFFVVVVVCVFERRR